MPWISILEIVCKLLGFSEWFAGYIQQKEAVKKANEVSDVQNTVNSSDDDTVQRMLREKYTRD